MFAEDRIAKEIGAEKFPDNSYSKQEYNFQFKSIIGHLADLFEYERQLLIAEPGACQTSNSLKGHSHLHVDQLVASCQQ
ncbi:MAG: hypothetical protein ACREBS_09865 [Nitrososphaerales archaeon]